MAIKTIAQTKWFPVFKVGTHTSADGVTRTYDEGFLDKVLHMNSGKESSVPLVLGHPQNDSPKYGTLGGLAKVVIDGVPHLMAKGADVVEQFADAVAARMFDQVSICTHLDGRLKHIGFLGAAEPAVEGLPRVEFAADAQPTETVSIQFAAPERGVLRDIVGVLSRMRDYLIGRDGVESANQVVSADLVQWLYTDIEKLGEPPAGAEASPASFTGGEMDLNVKALQDQVAQLTGQLAQFSKAAEERDALKVQVEKLTATNTELSGKLTAQQQAARAAEFSAFVDTLGTRVTPASRETVLGLMTAVADMAPVQFSAERTEGPLDALKALLTSLPEQVALGRVAGEGAGKGDNTSVADITARALQFQKEQREKGIEISTSQAVLAVTK